MRAGRSRGFAQCTQGSPSPLDRRLLADAAAFGHSRAKSGTNLSKGSALSTSVRDEPVDL